MNPINSTPDPQPNPDFESEFEPDPSVPKPATPPPPPPTGPPAPPPPLIGRPITPPPSPSTPSAPQNVAPEPPPVAARTPTAQTGPMPVIEGMKRLGEWILPPHLRTAYKGATPSQLFSLYGGRVAALVVFIALMASFAYPIFMLLSVVALVCLLAGWKKPDAFRFLFGDQATKKTVGWTFGVLLLVFAGLGSALEPKPVVSPQELAAKRAQAKAQEEARQAEQRANAAEVSAKEAEAKARRAEKSAALANAEAKEARAQQAKREDKIAASEVPAKAQEKVKTTPEPTLDPNAPKVDILGTHAIRARVSVGEDGVTLQNNDRFAYGQVQIILNSRGVFGGYFYITERIYPGEKIEVPFEEFATKKDAKRFQPLLTKLEDITLRCRTDYGMGVGSYSVD